MSKPTVRRQSEYVPLTKEAFRERFFARFYDPVFEEVGPELEKVFEKAWDGYIVYRKSPRKRPAGEGYSDPSFELPIEWLGTRAKIDAAERRQKDPNSPSRILIINGSTRSEHTCPGEISKTRRLAQHAQEAIQSLAGYEVDFLDISGLADEPWKVIHPCKACVSTSQALCHWPCSCYPNHALGQTNDWMEEIYPRWTAAHGVFVLCPVHWYQAPASLKLMWCAPTAAIPIRRARAARIRCVRRNWNSRAGRIPSISPDAHLRSWRMVMRPGRRRRSIPGSAGTVLMPRATRISTPTKTFSCRYSRRR